MSQEARTGELRETGGRKATGSPSVLQTMADRLPKGNRFGVRRSGRSRRSRCASAGSRAQPFSQSHGPPCLIKRASLFGAGAFALSGDGQWAEIVVAKNLPDLSQVTVNVDLVAMTITVALGWPPERMFSGWLGL